MTALVPVFGSRPVFVTVPSEGGPVTVCVSVHDAYHLHMRSIWRQRLLESRRIRETLRQWDSWRRSEWAWYAALHLNPPSHLVHRRVGRRRSRLCVRGHVKTLQRDRQVCRACLRLSSAAWRRKAVTLPLPRGR